MNTIPETAPAQALYLYCIRERTAGAPAISAGGIGGTGEVFTLLHRRLEAVVSGVSLKEFGSGGVREKAREDLGWIRKKAVLHQETIEAAVKKNDTRLNLIPMRFGIIFNGEKSLKATLDKNYARIMKKLGEIRGKQEWGLKVYQKAHKRFEEGVKKKSALIKEKSEELAELPEGAAFFAEEGLKALIARETAEELDGFAQGLFEAFKDIAAASVKTRNLDRALTGRAEPMILNAAYLIPEESVIAFRKKAEKANKEIRGKGFYLEYSGPWPAYNFAGY